MTKTSLFSPCNLGELVLKNRIAMAPMTRSRATDDGTPVPLMAEYYAQRSDAGLIISEGTNISAQGQGFVNTPGIYTESHIEGWKKVTEAVHAHRSAFFLQLWHVGRVGHPDNMEPGLHPMAPSAVVHPRTVVTRTGQQPMLVPIEMSLENVRQTINDYAIAASNAIRAGCDGIEIHAANGYLPSQFLHSTSNLRTDGYGGSINNRIRFLVEVAEACVAAVGADRVGVRLTPFSAFNGATSSDEAELYRSLIPTLAALRLGYLHAVRAEVSGNVTVTPTDGQQITDVLGFVRPLWPHTLIAAGDFDLSHADEVVASGKAEMVAFGRDFISNPDLVNRLQNEYPLAPRNPTEWYGSGAEGYTDYPRWQDAESGTMRDKPQEAQ